MSEFLKLLIPFLSTPTNYSDVLKQLAAFAFYETYIVTLLLRANPRFDAFLIGIESWGPIHRVLAIVPQYDAWNLAGLLLAFLVGILTHAFHFHDRISDLLGIRRNFDLNNILIPLARRVGSEVTADKETKISESRDELMHAVFYKYASSSADRPLVDNHDIEQALGTWFWFWVFVEGTFYFGFGAIIGWWLNSPELAILLLIIAIVLLALAIVRSFGLGKYAQLEIDAIVADPTASYNVKKRFDAL